MDRGHRTVALVAGNDRRATAEALELLGQCLSEEDTVVVPEPNQAPDAASPWWVQHRGGLVPSAVPGAWAPVVVVLDARAAPIGPWLEPLVGALEDRSVGAAAPRTNLAAGEELLVGVPYRPDEGQVHRAFVEQRAADPTRTGATRLDGPCLAMRSGDFESVGGPRAIGGPSPVAQLARRVSERGKRLVVAEGSYLHMAGGPDPRAATDASPPLERGAPLVSACLIVKDEEDNLTRCLRSLERLCDEVVVYDTGSRDRTVEVARTRGATVVEGYWDDDFGRARNAALAHCRGQWVLWIDADEELDCAQPSTTRRQLASLPGSTEALIVLVDNVRGTRASTSLAHPACRLFRRAYGQWTGRIHEQVRARAGSPELRSAMVNGVRITHWGYLRSTVQQRAKGDRNVRSAFADVAGDAALPWATRLVSLARSYGLKGQPQEAVDLSVAALGAATEPHLRRLATRTLVDALLALGDPEATLREVAALRNGAGGAGKPGARGAGSATVAVAEGRARLALGQPALALEAFTGVPVGLDEDGFEIGRHDMAADTARALGQLGRFEEAADTLLACIGDTGGMDAPVAVLLECLERSGRSAGELARVVPADRQVAFLGQLLNTGPELADRALEAWQSEAPAMAVLATAAAVAPSLPLARQMVWSARLREQGVARACPLVATVAHDGHPVAERLLAAALAVQLWGDRRARPALTALSAMLPAGEGDEALAQVAAVAPGLEPVTRGVEPSPPPLQYRTAGASGGRSRRVLVVDRHPGGLRSMALAAALHRAGHAVTLCGPSVGPATERRPTSGGIGWLTWPLPATDWQQACGQVLAQAVAADPYDTVVLAPAALTMTAPVRRLAPQAALVADLDDQASLPPGVEPLVDLLLVSAMGASPLPGARAGATRWAVVDASAGELFAPAPPTPWDLRHGAAVVGDFAAAAELERQRWRRTLAPALDRHLAAHPIVLIGHDPDGAVSEALPAALGLGAQADPLSWLRAARVVVVATETGARHWRILADLAGTPVLTIEPGGLTGAGAGDRLASLARGAAAVVDAPAPPAAAPAPAAAGGASRAGRAITQDPLAALDRARHRATPARAQGTAGNRARRVTWSAGSPTRGQVRAAQEEGAKGAQGAAGRHLGDRGAGAVLEIRGGQWPDLAPRGAERVVVELQWGYSVVPVEWIGPLRAVADEVWVPSPWQAQVLGGAGLDPDVVQVVPPGVDVRRFAPGRPPYALRTDRSVRFLFVGACDDASGVDALLEAYLTAFTDSDDVCLVVYPTGPAAGRTYEADLRRAAAGASGRPAVEMVDPDLAAGDLPGLYRACDVLVHPHRAAPSPEVALQAMACGRPVVTLDGGPVRDVCDGHTGWTVTCRPVRAPSPDGLVVPTPLLQLEPRRAALSAALREAAHSADRRLCKGMAARDRVVSRYAFDDVASLVAARIDVLCAGASRAAGAAGQPPAVPAAG